MKHVGYWNAFLSRHIDGTLLADANDEFDDMQVEASSKQDARMNLAQYFTALGAKAILLNTSEEVWVTLPDGRELVYYGFDED